MAGGDDDFETLFRAEMPPLVATLRRITNDLGLAEEIAQDAFTKALVRWRRVRRYDRPGAWVRRVAIRDAVRATSRARRSSPLGAQLTPAASSASFVDPELVAAVRDLPAQQRAAVVLYYLEDRPTSEVADSIGCSEATVRSHLRRARRHLAEALGATDDEGVVDDAHR